MALVEDFFRKHFIDAHVCSDCGRHFPASMIITLDSYFPELAGKYCQICFHKIYDLIGYCDECGNEFPKQHLYKSMFDQTVVCKGCLHEQDR
jgi:DNA-directed RNA polymerase subunit RPC12/RpoP